MMEYGKTLWLSRDDGEASNVEIWEREPWKEGPLDGPMVYTRGVGRRPHEIFWTFCYVEWLKGIGIKIAPGELLKVSLRVHGRWSYE